jgi:hypothetical protein
MRHIFPLDDQRKRNVFPGALFTSPAQNGTAFQPCSEKSRVWSAKCGDVGSVDCE